MFGYYFDPTYFLVIIGAILCMGASQMVTSTYRKYSKVQIQHVRGDLTDHYDPVKKVLRLSDTVYDSRSVAAIGVAAHECGHALQHKEGYFPLKFRSALVPAANIGSKLGLPLVILGLVLGIGFDLPGGGYFSLAQIGIWVFALAVLFQLVTLPVEFNASGRALKMLGSYGVMTDDEVDDCKRVLGAAALTYVAAAASSVLQLLRLLLLAGNRRRDD